MSISKFTRPFEIDGRLKIFWLDDNRDSLMTDERKLVSESQGFSPWFSITSGENLSDLKEVRDSCPRKPYILDYDLLEAPFDIYILDFRLCDGKEHCQNPEHSTSGLHAPAAGLLGGMLAAMEWPDHTQAIIPYSGYPEEIGDVWHLCRNFAPPCVHVAEEVMAKDRSDFQGLLSKVVAANYRQALIKAIATGRARIPAGEIRRIASYRAGGDDAMSAEHELQVTTAYGLRGFKLGALFFDLMDKKAKTIRVDLIFSQLLDRIETDTPVFAKALLLSDLFWTLRISNFSHKKYDSIISGQPIDGGIGFPWIGDRQWRSGSKKPALVQEGKRVVRLAILLLLLREHAMRSAFRKIPVDEKSLELLKIIVERFNPDDDGDGIIEFLSNRDGAPDQIFKGLLDAQAELEFSTGASMIDLIYARQAITELDIVRLVDPLPTNSDIKSLDAGQKIGNALPNFLLGENVGEPGRDIDMRALLTCDATHSRKMLTDEEWSSLQRYSLELVKTGDKPLWLSV
jgi:hypothetical protein